MKPLVNRDLLKQRIAGTLCNMERLFNFMRRANVGGSGSKDCFKQLYYQLSLTIDACAKCLDELEPKVKPGNAVTVNLPGFDGGQ